MSNKKDQEARINYTAEGFFFFFGLVDNPAKKDVKKILDSTPSENIKRDLRRVNEGYRQQYLRIKKDNAFV